MKTCKEVFPITLFLNLTSHQTLVEYLEWHLMDHFHLLLVLLLARMLCDYQPLFQVTYLLQHQFQRMITHNHRSMYLYLFPMLFLPALSNLFHHIAIHLHVT